MLQIFRRDFFITQIPHNDRLPCYFSVLLHIIFSTAHFHWCCNPHVLVFFVFVFFFFLWEALCTDPRFYLLSPNPITQAFRPLSVILHPLPLGYLYHQIYYLIDFPSLFLNPTNILYFIDSLVMYLIEHLL